MACQWVFVFFIVIKAFKKLFMFLLEYSCIVAYMLNVLKSMILAMGGES